MFCFFQRNTITIIFYTVHQRPVLWTQSLPFPRQLLAVLPASPFSGSLNNCPWRLSCLFVDENLAGGFFGQVVKVPYFLSFLAQYVKGEVFNTFPCLFLTLHSDSEGNKNLIRPTDSSVHYL